MIAIVDNIPIDFTQAHQKSAFKQGPLLTFKRRLI